uniref:RING-type E3 ubiquitin transferase n=1 Tax=Gouania willdenowi TaxID=441366 RepID=A0A8C5EI76_GOUWI
MRVSKTLLGLLLDDVSNMLSLKVIVVLLMCLVTNSLQCVLTIPLLFATLLGTVKSIGEPLRSRFYNNTLGVLHEYRLLWRSWSCPCVFLSSMVPFVLVGSDETTVRVENPFHASGDYMEIIKKKFYDRVWAFPSAYHISGVKPFGYMETEKMLKVGTTLTGIGELIMDRDENLSLRPPINGAKYLLSLGDFSNVKDEALSSTFWWKVQSGFFALAGVAMDRKTNQTIPA